MNEKIKEIAEFDGWKELSNKMYRKEGNIQDYSPSMLTYYLTNLSLLHRVALDVMDRLQAFNYYSDMIRNSLTERPVNGEYTDLVDAVYEAIVYMKNHNLCQPK